MNPAAPATQDDRAAATRRGEFAAIDPAVAARMLKQATLCWMHPVLISEALDKRVADEAQLASELETMLDLLMRGLMAES